MIGLNGHKVLDEVLKKRSGDRGVEVTAQNTAPSFTGDLFLSISGLRAGAVQSNEGIVVPKGSDATNGLATGMSAGYRELHQKLIDNGALVPDVKWLTFQKDTLFTSPSTATVVLGYHTNGRLTWNDKGDVY